MQKPYKNAISVGARAFRDIALLPAIICGLLVTAVYISGHYLAGTESSLAMPFAEYLIFYLATILAGAGCAILYARRKAPLSVVARSAAASGLIVGVGGVLGHFLAAGMQRYNGLDILMAYGPASLLDGVVIGLIAGILTYGALSVKWHHKPCTEAFKLGLVFGLVLVALSVIPESFGLIFSGTGIGPVLSDMWMMFEYIFSFIGYIMVAAAGALVVRRSGVGNFRGAMAVSCVCGSLMAVFTGLADAVLVYVRYVRHVLPVEGTSGMGGISGALAANYFRFLQGEPLFMLMILGVTVVIGIIYGMWELSLHVDSDAPSEK